MNRVEGHTHLYDRNDPSGLRADLQHPQTAAHDLNDARPNESEPEGYYGIGSHDGGTGCLFGLGALLIGTTLSSAILNKLSTR